MKQQSILVVVLPMCHWIIIDLSRAGKFNAKRLNLFHGLRVWNLSIITWEHNSSTSSTDHEIRLTLVPLSIVIPVWISSTRWIIDHKSLLFWILHILIYIVNWNLLNLFIILIFWSFTFILLLNWLTIHYILSLKCSFEEWFREFWIVSSKWNLILIELLVYLSQKLFGIIWSLRKLWYAWKLIIMMKHSAGIHTFRQFLSPIVASITGTAISCLLLWYLYR